MDGRDALRALITGVVNKVYEDLDRASPCGYCCADKIESLAGKVFLHYTCIRCGNRWKVEKGQVH